ncbi:3-deoxy-8-phosphooctulonate synthase [Megalodesulfovibrio gigas]|uniref:2-dehydro-3-deoxyphosphooctonate aldolase n=1 Tax=Megalodesulfovibrio gigas (strain ATCC 19364 / DSM 1382 / NCIMB 9332 / VKM B-1759) TaxID=1121448 RepID=T2GF71_MEGG1|nr:3-deoxy-8-phosphooctulonate synthase [Megalodesulfovibrio gigas]AGW15225.1 2-dehydro-3-deoxyphosphooctonate aldolase [Megalodesulfovibrio gigas DSM 1382 = ATCC 19364]
MPSPRPSRLVRLDPPFGITLGNELPLVVIAGPCAMEGMDFGLRTASALQEIFAAAGIAFIYKSSFDKANRTSGSAFRGVGMDEGLEILARIKSTLGLPVLTDVHTPEQAAPVAQVADMLQTPAFLCRQTDFIQAVAATGKPVNLKKGQFLAPWDMAQVLEKARATGNERLTLCERGTMFGYGNLVADMRSLAIMAGTGFPVIFDATHSVQLPGGQGTSSGGQREFVPPLARAAVATGVAALFLETHPDPAAAPCDGPNMLPFHELPALLRQLKAIDTVTKG